MTHLAQFAAIRFVLANLGNDRIVHQKHDVLDQIVDLVALLHIIGRNTRINTLQRDVRSKTEEKKKKKKKKESKAKVTL